MASKKLAGRKTAAKVLPVQQRLLNQLEKAEVDVKTMNTLQLFLKAVSELYRLDKSAPGISLAWLPDKGVFYASFCRYEGPIGEGKQVMTNAVGATLEEAIAKLAQNWYDGVPSGRALRDFVIKNRPHNFFDQD